MAQNKNILVLFTDQQRRDTIHALGNDRIITPALDSIVENAVVFDNCFTPAPVCVPARYSLFSGQYPARTGCCNNNPVTEYNGNGFYSLFTDNQFATFCVGKMHFPNPLYSPMGFEKRLTQEEMAAEEDDYTKFILNSPYRNVFDYNGMRSEMYYVPQISQLPAEYHPTQWVGDNTVTFIDNYEDDRPFFLFSSFIHPHPPFAPPAPWNKLYRTVSAEPYMPEDMHEFESFLSDRFVLNKVGISRQDLTLLRNYYYSCVSFVDYQIGRIIDALKRKKLYDNTIIVFTSDHGEMLGDFGTMGKRSMLDGSVHIPLILSVPGIQPQHRKDVCSLVDLAPTLLSLAGIEYAEDEYDGLDLFGSKKHTEVFSQYSTGSKGTYMIATEDDKLVYSGPYQQYYYFNKIPEDTNKYDPNNSHIFELQKHLEDYISSDVGKDGSGSADAVSGISKFPYGPKRADHIWRHNEELSRMPYGYQIDIE